MASAFKRFQPYLWLALAALVVAPVFLRGLPCSDDTLPHFFRVVQLDINLHRGAPFLQWGPDFMHGYGYPIFAFYAPLTYWLIEAIHLAGADFGPALQITYFATLLLAAWGAYHLARHSVGIAGAFVAGLAYLFSPYLLYDTIQRGALPEALALALLPWALTAARKATLNGTPRAIALAALVFSALILAHNVIPVFGIGFALALSLSRSPNETSTPSGDPRRATVISLTLALGLTAFFWLPAFAELPYTQSSRPDPYLPDWPSFEAHLVPPQALMEWPSEPADPQLLNPPVSRTLGWAQVLFALVGLATLARPHPRRGELLILSALTLGCVFFASTLSKAWWENLAPLNFIQLPTRFLGPASLGLAILAGLAADRLWHYSTAWLQSSLTTFTLTTAAFVISAGVIAISGWPWLYPRYCPAPEHSTPATLVHSTTWQRRVAEAAGEVLPRWVDRLPPEDAFLPQYDAGQPINRLLMPDGARLDDWRTWPGHDHYALTLSAPVSVTYRTFYFPGWNAALDGKPIPIQITPQEGLIAVALPAGQHSLDISFQRTPIRVMTLIVSGLFVLLTFAIGRVARPQKILSEQADLFTRPELAAIGLTTLTLIGVKFGVIDRIASPIRADRFQDGQLLGLSHPATVDFQGEVTYLGYSGPARVRSDETFLLTQYWTRPNPEPLGATLWFAVQVADDAGQVWSLPTQRPWGYTFFPNTDEWSGDEYARDAYQIQLLPGTPPGEYGVEVRAYRTDTLAALIPVDAPTGRDPGNARVGKIGVTPGTAQPDVKSAAVDTYSPTEVLPGLTLLGWSLTKVSLSPGDSAHLELLWTAPQKLSGGDRVAKLSIVSATGNTVADQSVIIGGSHYPPSDWAPGTLARNQTNWRLPPQLDAGNYTVKVAVGEGPPIPLGPLTVTAIERIFTQPPVAQETQLTFGFAQLSGFTLTPPTLTPGQTLTLDLAWKAMAETETGYRVFVHVIDSNQVIRAQSDSVPAEWTRPTPGWLPGEYILDPHTLPLPPNLAPGAYRLFVGLYDPATGERIGEAVIAEFQVR